MVFLSALLAAATAQLDAQPASPATGVARAQATATIRIVQSESLRFAQIEQEDPQRLRVSKARLADGSLETLHLIEFE